MYFIQTGGTQPKIHKPGNAQQAFFSHVSEGLNSVRSARDDLEKSADLPPLGEDPVSRVFKVISSYMRKQIGLKDKKVKNSKGKQKKTVLCNRI